MRNWLFFLFVILSCEIQAKECETIEVKPEKEFVILEGAPTVVVEPIYITHCGAIPQLNSIKDAVEFLLSTLPRGYLASLRKAESIKNIDDVFFDNKRGLTFVHLMDAYWVLLGGDDESSAYSNLKRVAEKEGYFYTEFYFFETLVIGVWQMLHNKQVDLDFRVYNARLIDLDKDAKPPSFSSLCDSPMFEYVRSFYYYNKAEVERRVRWNYCVSNKTLYSYLFETGWVPMDELQKDALRESVISVNILKDVGLVQEKKGQVLN